MEAGAGHLPAAATNAASASSSDQVAGATPKMADETSQPETSREGSTPGVGASLTFQVQHDMTEGDSSGEEGDEMAVTQSNTLLKGWWSNEDDAKRSLAE